MVELGLTAESLLPSLTKRQVLYLEVSMLLEYYRDGSASVRQLHVFYWCFRSFSTIHKASVVSRGFNSEITRSGAVYDPMLRPRGRLFNMAQLILLVNFIGFVC
jgi:hypothetical protein